VPEEIVVGDIIAAGLIVVGMGLSWLYAVAIDRWV